MSVVMNVCMFKIMRTPTKLGVRSYAMYANYRTLWTNKQEYSSHKNKRFFIYALLHAIPKSWKNNLSVVKDT